MRLPGMRRLGPQVLRPAKALPSPENRVLRSPGQQRGVHGLRLAHRGERSRLARIGALTAAQRGELYPS